MAGGDAMDGVCTALSLADESKCSEPATNANGLFCSLHARQVQGLYSGYKRRNAQLDALDAAPPPYLATSKLTLRNEDFASVADDQELRQLEDYLFEKYRLLERVIRARKIHHAHFYAQTMDYGHKQYLDKLVNDKNVVLGALHRLIRRTAEVRHKQKKWFKFVRERQDEEEALQEKEVIKVKKEAQLFRRYMKQVETRTQLKRRQEDKKRQDAFLDQVYQERLRQEKESDVPASDEDWDPIEDIIKGEREDLIALMYRLLWLEMPQPVDTDAQEGVGAPQNVDAVATQTQTSQSASANKENVHPDPTKDGQSALSRNAKKRAKAKAKAKAVAEMPKEAGSKESESENSPKIELNETREQMRERLLKGVSYEEHGMRMVRNPDRPDISEPVNLPGMPADEADKLLDEVADIKELLFCRLILSQSDLLPIALRANSVSDFFADPELNLADLRDLCLRYEQPKLQEIRDACADFARGDGEEEDDEEDEEDEQTAHELALREKYKKDSWRGAERPESERHDGIPERYRTKHEKAVEAKKAQRQQLDKEGFGDVVVDFGEIDDEGKFHNKKVRIRVCGRTIWNYPSERAMARGGWLQFSVMAKGSRFEDAVGLCRNWNEFWELSNLAIFNYFSSTSWTQWSGGSARKQQLQLGIISYMEFVKAHEFSVRRARIASRAVSRSLEFKNFTAFCIKRNDPVSRRFVQYLSMQNRHVCLMVRDAKTGKVLIQPPEEHTWLVRSAGGLGDDDWVVQVRVGDEKLFKFFEGMRSESWQFGFNDYYDVTVWDLLGGEQYSVMYSAIQDAMIKARRVCTGHDYWASVAPIMRTLHRENRDNVEGVDRVRDARPGESTMYDEMYADGVSFRYGQIDPSTGEHGPFREQAPTNYFYNDVDAAEDLVLFPEEAQGLIRTAITGVDDTVKPNLKRFVLGLDSDDESDDQEDPFEGKLGSLAIADESEDQQLQLTAEGEGEWETESSEDDFPMPPEDIPNCPYDGEVEGCKCQECEWWKVNDKEIIPSLEDSVKRYGHAPILPIDVDALISDNRQATRLKKYIFEGTDARHSAHRDLQKRVAEIDDDFAVFMDREKSKKFKRMWHAAEFEPDARSRWSEMQAAIKEGRAFVVRDIVTLVESFSILMWLGMDQFEHKRVLEDMWDALAATSLFFVKPNAAKIKALLAQWETRSSEAGKPSLTDNEAKARLLKPYDRTWRSNKTQPKDFWTEVDRVMKTYKDHAPHDWDLHCRPRVAMLAQAGVIGPGFCPYPEGTASFAGDSDHSPGLVIDYRAVKEDWPEPNPAIRDHRKIHLLPFAQAFARKHPNARFALLRVWSHPLFYPLMLGIPSRPMTSFEDTLGRAWEFKFIPRDMPGSEWSIQKNVEDRLFGIMPPKLRPGMTANLNQMMLAGQQGAPRFKKLFKDKMEVKRDMVLVMGEDETDLERLVAAATFALQTNPWRLEVDFWKSFVNVDLPFLENLDKKWLE